MSSVTTRLKACEIRLNYVAEEIGSVAGDIFDGNARQVLVENRYRSLARQVLEIKKSLSEIRHDILEGTSDE